MLSDQCSGSSSSSLAHVLIGSDRKTKTPVSSAKRVWQFKIRNKLARQNEILAWTGRRHNTLTDNMQIALNLSAKFESRANICIFNLAHAIQLTGVYFNCERIFRIQIRHRSVPMLLRLRDYKSKLRAPNACQLVKMQYTTWKNAWHFLPNAFFMGEIH